MSKLHQCPFCGLDENDHQYPAVTNELGDICDDNKAQPPYFVECPHCLARGPESVDTQEAADLWNHYKDYEREEEIPRTHGS